jgi:perosamine synthetase
MDISVNEMIPIYKPYLKKYKKSALEAIESEWISNHGKYIELSTNKLKSIIQSNYCILMMNGTVATHCLFIALKYKYPQIDTIYLPNNVYVAVYNTALIEYNIGNIEILKIDEETWNMNLSEEYIKSLKSNSAIMIVHNLGNIIDVEKIHRIRPDIQLIEDNCEGLFGKYNDIYSGTSQNILCSSVSFYGNKTITTGEGGAFFTQHKDIFEYIKKVFSQGMSNIRYIHDVHAYNYRMTNIQSAFLYDQLNDIDTILKRKQEIFDIYLDCLNPLINNNKIKIQKTDNNTNRANWMFGLRILNNKYSIEKTYNFFIEHGIETRPFFYSYNSHQHLKLIKCHEDCEISQLLNKEIIMIPSFPELKYEEQLYIVKVINNFIENIGSESEPNFIEIESNNKNILELLLKKDISESFRYYKKRNINAIDNHLVTLILRIGSESIGYGHIDFENDKYWIGLFIVKEFQSKGYGKLILETLINKSNNFKLKEIYLSVDVTNNSAYNLYSKYNFEIIELLNDKYIMKKIL